MFSKKAVLNNFAKFAGKHLSGLVWGLIKNNFLKNMSGQLVFLRYFMAAENPNVKILLRYVYYNDGTETWYIKQRKLCCSNIFVHSISTGWKSNLILKIDWWKIVVSFLFFRRLVGLSIIVIFIPEIQKNSWVFICLVFVSIDRVFQIQEFGTIELFFLLNLTAT